MWLNKDNSFEWRHGDNCHVMMFIKGAIAEHVIQTIGGLVGDDGCDNHEPDFEKRNPTFRSYFLKFHSKRNFWRWSMWRFYRKLFTKKEWVIING